MTRTLGPLRRGSKSPTPWLPEEILQTESPGHLLPGKSGKTLKGTKVNPVHSLPGSVTTRPRLPVLYPGLWGRALLAGSEKLDFSSK